MADEEEKHLEDQLQLQLQEQRESLASINEALLSDASNSELLAVHEELVEAIKDAEEGLFHLKRARLLREADSVLDSFNHTSMEAKAEPLDPKNVEPEPLEDRAYSVGSKCIFRYVDGRWYDGQVFGFEASDLAKISFLTPTSENMLMCKFFLQQRCRFGTNCRLSHGVDVPLSSLRKYTPTVWEQSLVGSSIWAVASGNDGLWREAELESWDDELRVGQVVFRDDGSSLRLGMEAMALSEYAQMSGGEEEESDSGSEQYDSTDYEEESPEGVGFLDSTALQKGIQTDTVIFAKWENHTRGIASKMMANMGYREGMGLGVAGQGMLDPISVKVHPGKASVEHALQSKEGEERKQGKKRSRGGMRKREKKFAAAARAAKAREECSPDVFSLINKQLANCEAMSGASTRKQQKKGAEGEKKVDRRALVAYDDEVAELKNRVEKLEEMVNRNRKEKAVYEAAIRKLNETRRTLAEVMAAHASASNAVVSREKEKRWLKF